MNAFFTVLILIAQISGLWNHLSLTTHRQLASLVITKPSSLAQPNIATELPVQSNNEPLSYPSTESVYAIDVSSGTELYEQNAMQVRPIASITKLVTTLVILSRHSLNETVTVPQLPIYPTDAETLGLTAGQTYTVRDLLTAALVPSDNDAADTLAIWDSGSISAFAKLMNMKLAQWQIIGAKFSNSSGLTDTGNGASAEALAKIAELVMASPFVRSTVMLPAATITSGQGLISHLTSTDDLLATGGFYGIKTGYTAAAGDCFVGLTTIAGHPVITVVLGSTDRFGDTLKLTNWITRNWQWLP